MKSKKIIDTYNTRLKKISRHHHQLLNDFDNDENHKFRVEMKKLRAFIRLVNLAKQDQDKIPKSIKKFYHDAGDIRNLQMHEQRINNLAKDLSIESPHLYLEQLKAEEKATLRKAREITGDISLKDFEEKLIVHAPVELTRENKTEFVKNNFSRLSLLLMLPIYFDETFHDVRKIVKDLMYNYEHLKDAVVTIIPYPLNDSKFMEKLADAIGDFHDLCLALFFLSPLYTDGIENTNEVTTLAEMKAHLQLRKDKLKNELFQLLVPVKQQIESHQAITG